LWCNSLFSQEGNAGMQYLLDPANYNFSDPNSIPNLTFQHLVITAISMGIALLIALPLGLLVARYRRLYLPVITVTGIIYTIPSLALLAILVPFTGLTPATMIIPLIAYAQLVLIRNVAAAVGGVDPVLLETGRAMGMNERQLLLRVTLPLALLVIMAGVRVATVTTIGIATLATLVGAGGLGVLIFGGINVSYPSEVLAGAILVSALALIVDLLLLVIQRGLSRGRQQPALQ
jgi:osmoprotectant transport system permease protein